MNVFWVYKDPGVLLLTMWSELSLSRIMIWESGLVEEVADLRCISRLSQVPLSVQFLKYALLWVKNVRQLHGILFHL